MRKAFNIVSNSQVSMFIEHCKKWGTPFLWCKSLWCVHKCYFQIRFPLSIFSFCMCSTILCFLHFNHLGYQGPMFAFVFQSCESTWGHCFLHQVLLQIHWLFKVCIKSHTIRFVFVLSQKQSSKYYKLHFSFNIQSSFTSRT